MVVETVGRPSWEWPIAARPVSVGDLKRGTFAAVRNIANARSKRERTAYPGVRGESPVSFVEERDRLIGPIYSFSVRSKF